MVEEDSFERVIAELTAARANTSCSGMARLLKSLGFSIRDGKKQGHRIYVHDGLPGFYSDSYTCGHGRNPTIDRVYVSKVINVLKRHERELTEYLRRNQ